jgi:MFS transporter, DHA2 family, methylenomycin A resistance protein
VLFVLRQKGSDDALMPLTMFRNRVFSASLGIASAMTFGMYAILFLTPLYLQAGRDDGALQAAIELLPMSVAFVLVSQLSGGGI